MYIIDPKCYGGVFVLPKSLTDELKLASGGYVKALVFAFANAGTPLDAAAVAEGAGLSEADAADALRYWAEKGFLTDPEKEAPAPEAAAPAQAEPPAKPAKELVDLKPTKPSYETICNRLNEDAAVRELFGEAQLKLGRTIGTADQASLLLLYDYYGLPAEVILAVCEYARIHKKERNMGYIYTVGADWSKRGIDSLEAADEELKRLENVNTNWTSFAKLTGLRNANPTPAQQKYLALWLGDWGFTMEMLGLANEEMLKNTGKVSFPYLNKILSTWKNAGVDTPEKAAAREKKFREDAVAAAAEKQTARAAQKPAVKKNKTAYENPASYDMDRAEHKMNTTVPKLKKKEKR